MIDAQNKPGHKNENTLWHGTAGNAKDSINTYGFNRSYCGKNGKCFMLVIIACCLGYMRAYFYLKHGQDWVKAVIMNAILLAILLYSCANIALN